MEWGGLVRTQHGVARVQCGAMLCGAVRAGPDRAGDVSAQLGIARRCAGSSCFCAVANALPCGRFLAPMWGLTWQLRCAVATRMSLRSNLPGFTGPQPW